MTYVVISSFENIETGDLQAQGEAVTLFDAEAGARAHFVHRSSALAHDVDAARKSDPEATFITWLLLLRMPLEVNSIDEALEDLELILEQTEVPDDPFGEFVVAYEGRQYAGTGTPDYSQADALRGLEAWLS
ncbi:MAG: hypothetical protein R3F08_06815 [Dokdonella sp.]|nr:hypothetical protein [Rhodocyclaceae bacterium]MCB1570603.1 hypothetical protein [Xanthomonadales bacterium]MCB1573498.1 hypothetical protein [Xanthomonadales bacterium]